MKKSGYASIQHFRKSVSVFCTDEKFLAEVFEELKKIITSHKTSNDEKLLNDEIYHIYLDGLDGKGEVVSFWILKHFVLHGWEPFELNGDFPRYEGSGIHLRYVENDAN